MKIVVFYVLCWIAVLGGIAGCEQPRAAQAPTFIGPKAAKPRQSPIAKREGWLPRDFFQSEEPLDIAKAISSGDLGRLQLLLDQNPDLDAPGRYGFTLLYWAFVEGNMDAFKMLLEQGADPDQQLAEYCPAKGWSVFSERNSVLISSVYAMRHDFWMAALPYSKNPNQPGTNGQNLIHYYFETLQSRGSEKHVQAMIDNGVEFDQRGAYGYTPCHWAVHKSPNICLLLLQAGADPSIRDDQEQDIVDAIESQLKRLRNSSTAAAEFDPAIKWLHANYRQVQTPLIQPTPQAQK
ncbi:ankyrin repeat domain-containing protein [Blastopirellula marina]|uniref:Uncharacterized protein n=1 Tax=Blastopirellula marina DSM 3645 TaxID=314230 RepID=A3ZQ33_9BACT|nr:ankyrin repeat domain-containing protein [Blastopirellula marina]EAQ81306.1 hypothetical protein DSM3645_22981 [Blastopirellula marina DSM 3645]